jgi:hypothetical protein
MELNNGVLPEPLPDFSNLLLVREPKPLTGWQASWKTY